MRMLFAKTLKHTGTFCARGKKHLLSMEACVIEYKGSLHVFRRTNDMPTSGMFMDRCWLVTMSRQSNAPDANLVDANKRVCEKYMGVGYCEHGVCTAATKKNVSKNKGAPHKTKES